MNRADLRHDLRTPLNQIIGYSELLGEEAEARGALDLAADLLKIGSAARQLLSLIERHFGDAPETPAAQRGEVAEPLAPEEPPFPADLGASVLVVDDNQDNRDMLARRLRARGYGVLTAASGRRALELLEEPAVDLVLLDVMMPEISGIDVLRRLRSRRSMVELPVIMATARDASEDTVQALELGANDYVTKPLDFPVVVARVETQLALKRASEEVRRLAAELELRNKFIRKTFGRYLSDEIVAAILETPQGLNLGGEKRTVTILMADLRGFSAMSETLAPEDVVGIVNNYLGVMTDIITRYQGTIDEFIGDAILAIFGAPTTREDDAERAVACAIAMQLAMASVNRYNLGLGHPDLQMGIALHTGEVVVGNLGSLKRTKYGVVGSPVNVAGRIESYTVGGQILISEATRRAAGPAVEAGERVAIEAKGIKDPVVAYDLRGIGAPHNLFLPETRDDLRPLAREIPVTWALLEGKHVGPTTFEGRIVRLSTESAEIHSADAMEPMSNLRMHVRDADGADVPGDLYVKVGARAPADGTFVVRFTASPPEVVKFLAAARGASSGDA
jgi:class 3 adenylate cyclase